MLCTWDTTVCTHEMVFVKEKPVSGCITFYGQSSVTTAATITATDAPVIFSSPSTQLFIVISISSVRNHSFEIFHVRALINRSLANNIRFISAHVRIRNWRFSWTSSQISYPWQELWFATIRSISTNSNSQFKVDEDICDDLKREMQWQKHCPQSCDWETVFCEIITVR